MAVWGRAANLLLVALSLISAHGLQRAALLGQQAVERRKPIAEGLFPSLLHPIHVHVLAFTTL